MFNVSIRSKQGQTIFRGKFFLSSYGALLPPFIVQNRLFINSTLVLRYKSEILLPYPINLELRFLCR